MSPKKQRGKEVPYAFRVKHVREFLDKQKAPGVTKRKYAAEISTPQQPINEHTFTSWCTRGHDSWAWVGFDSSHLLIPYRVQMLCIATC